MSDVAALEREYRRWLRLYPRSFRRTHEAEILAVLLATAETGKRRPDAMERLDLLRSALWMRLRPRVSRSDRPRFAAVRLMYLGALVEIAVAVTIVASMSDLRSKVAERNPGFTKAQWHTEVAGSLHPLVVAACAATIFWLVMAWANGRGIRGARIAFVIFVGLTTDSLLNGVVHGSAVYAPADLAAGSVLWVVQLRALALLFQNDLRRIKVFRSSAGRITQN
jgi:hypothetical protein